MVRVFPSAFFGDKIVPIEEATLSVTSSAVLYGLSVYTVFPVCITKDGLAAFRLPDHFARLVNSARIMGIDTFEPAWTPLETRTHGVLADQGSASLTGWTLERLTQAARDLIRANNISSDVLVRATVHVSESVPGVRSRGMATMMSIFVYETEPILPQAGARLKTSHWQRVPDVAIPSRAKVNGAYVNSVLGKQDALDSGYDDCLFLDALGHVCELSAANIFMVRDGILITPSVAGDILEGITRRTLLVLARDAGITAVERPVDLTELYVADEAFACGSSALVAPIVEIDKRLVGKGGVGSMTSKLRDMYVKILHGVDPHYADLLTRIS